MKRAVSPALIQAQIRGGNSSTKTLERIYPTAKTIWSANNPTITNLADGAGKGRSLEVADLEFNLILDFKTGTHVN